MSKIKNIFFISIIFFSIFSCQENSQSNTLSTIVNDYYQTYQARQDFQKFLNFYDAEVILEDMISGERKKGKAELANFFDWGNPNFSKTNAAALVIDNQIIGSNQVVTQGYFTAFQWAEQKFPPMQFTTILTFNQVGKIVKHIDWINYPASLIDYEKRKNSNDWIPSSTQ